VLGRLLGDPQRLAAVRSGEAVTVERAGEGAVDGAVDGA
jgi:hypothetical protein